MFASLEISTPKRNRQLQAGWEGFFPYYAGYPEIFASKVIESAALPPRSVILDPWNGSGTTIYAARQHGHLGLGFDLNPVMVVVARARMLLPSEADVLEPLGQRLLEDCAEPVLPLEGEHLLNWFEPYTARCLRDIERSISSSLVGRFTLSGRGADLDRLSSIASSFYVALFAVCRELASPFRSSNPTWLRKATGPDELVAEDRVRIHEKFITHVSRMADALAERADDYALDHSFAEAKLADSGTFRIGEQTIDFILTSPPYCTRIDYAAATQIELAILEGLMQADVLDLSRRIIGSTRVPTRQIEVAAEWGSSCDLFLERVRTHPSKASSGYYLKTHLDYFDKMSSSIGKLSRALKENGAAIFVVQDSFYKDIHNDIPTIITEMAGHHGLAIRRRENFPVRRSMSMIHSQSGKYVRKHGTVEAVLCFQKGNT